MGPTAHHQSTLSLYYPLTTLRDSQAPPQPSQTASLTEFGSVHSLGWGARQGHTGRRHLGRL
jgi:hypothetical protein